MLLVDTYFFFYWDLMQHCKRRNTFFGYSMYYCNANCFPNGLYLFHKLARVKAKTLIHDFTCQYVDQHQQITWGGLEGGL